MNVKRFLSVSVFAATCVFSFGSVSAQSLARDKGPAELPPASFTANQYVDSKGCVYIRAGVDGNTNWVPRVSRSRKVVCGLSPSIRSGAGTTAVAAAPAVRQVQEPVQIGVAESETAPKSPTKTAVRPARATVASVLAPRPVRTVASKPFAKERIAPTVVARRPQRPSTFTQTQPPAQTARVQRVQPQRRVQQAQSRVVRVAPTSKAVKPRRIGTNTQRAANSAQTCRGASAVSQRYIGGRNSAVRCGPQTQAFVTRAGDVKGGIFRSANGQVLSNVSPNAIVVPRHVYEEQQSTLVTSATQKGYRNAWTDDRLNARRMHQTLGGKAQMDLVWTQTVPRRLIARSTGRDVTRSFPGLNYPYTSAAQQNAAWTQGTRVVSTRGQTPRLVQQRQVVRQQAAAPRKQVRVSTRTSAPRKPAAVSGKRFVQVGTFGVASNAQNTAALIQRMGLPVRIGKFSRGGKEMRIVLAGPFKSSAHVGGALNAVRQAGFRDAFARN
jgi:hypothetical protein